MFREKSLGFIQLTLNENNESVIQRNSFEKAVAYTYMQVQKLLKKLHIINNKK